MKHKVHSVKNHHITCGIYDDSGKEIIGNYMTMFDTEPKDMDAYFTDKIYPDIEAMMTPPKVIETTTIDASPILMAMETTKEGVKFDLIAYLKKNPAISMTDFFTHCEDTYGWAATGLITNMIYEYVKQAEKKGLIPKLVDITKPYFVAVLKAIVINSTDEELKERLK